jgi:hypothetical protein
MSDINVIYRLSDNGYKKPKFPHATKLHCLENCLKEFDINNVHLFVDETNLLPATRAEIETIDSTRFFGNLQYYTGGSSAGSWRHVFDYAFANLTDPNDIVYFLEDDYLHLPNSAKAIVEGLQIAHYVSLYDHNDKYIPGSKGGNPYIGDDAGELTKVFRTASTHWKLTNSTTMTFATTMQQLHDDEKIWRDFTTGTHPNDFGCFMYLREKSRALITPIPGLSTHCEPMWAAPGIDWSVV